MPEQLTEERLRGLEIQNAEILAMLRQLNETLHGRIAADDKWRARVDRIIVGDGNGSVGHQVKIDRLEQSHERQKWMVRSLLVPVVLLALRQVASMLGS